VGAPPQIHAFSLAAILSSPVLGFQKCPLLIKSLVFLYTSDFIYLRCILQLEAWTGHASYRISLASHGLASKPKQRISKDLFWILRIDQLDDHVWHYSISCVLSRACMEGKGGVYWCKHVPIPPMSWRCKHWWLLCLWSQHQAVGVVVGSWTWRRCASLVTRRNPYVSAWRGEEIGVERPKQVVWGADCLV
jgi:hypothetical protein